MKKGIIFLLAVLLNTALFAKNKTWTCINENGETMFRIEAIYVSDFSNGLAKVYKNTLVNNQWITGYGFVNAKGEVVIPCNFKDAKDFKSTVTWVKRSGESFYTLIDQKGNVIPTKHYEKVKSFYDFQQDVCAVYEDGKMGFIDKSGKEIIPCKYIGSSAFSEGLASVCLASSVKEAYGYINKEGEEVIPLKFVQAGTSDFRNGLARATVDGKTVLIDKSGNVVFKTDKGNIQGQNFGLITVITKPNRKGWGWINFEDEFVIKPEYDYAKNFNEDGYAIVEKRGLKGVIDTTGKVVIPLEYETVYADITKDGFFAGVRPGKSEGISMANAQKDYFDKDFNELDLDGVKYIMGARRGNRIAFCTMDGRLGYFDRNFEIAIPAQYSKANFFNEGYAWVRD